jgi:hypothetical protein
VPSPKEGFFFYQKRRSKKYKQMLVLVVLIGTVIDGDRLAKVLHPLACQGAFGIGIVIGR